MKFVIEHGNTMISAKCRKCGCRYMYQENDIEFECKTEKRDIPNPILGAYKCVLDYCYVRCPECGAKMKLEHDGNTGKKK